MSLPVTIFGKHPADVGLALGACRTLTDHIKGAAPPVVTNVRQLVKQVIEKLVGDTKLDAVRWENTMAGRFPVSSTILDGVYN